LLTNLFDIYQKKIVVKPNIQMDIRYPALPNIRPGIRYPACGLAGYPVSGLTEYPAGYRYPVSGFWISRISGIRLLD
jgi:hypothetical protein